MAYLRRLTIVTGIPLFFIALWVMSHKMPPAERTASPTPSSVAPSTKAIDHRSTTPPDTQQSAADGRALIAGNATTPRDTSPTSITLFASGVPPAPLVVNAGANADTKTAVAAMAGYLKRMTGVPFPVSELAAGAPLPQRCVVIGDGWLTAPKSTGNFGFATKIVDGRLYIVGDNWWGTCTGVYKFLEDQLGCRWWGRDEDFVPTHSEIVLSDIDRIDKPAFPYGGYLMNKEATVNPFMFGTLSKRNYHFLWVHNLPSLLSPYTRKHPEFLPHVKGTPSPKWNGVHLNYTAPGIAEALADAMGKKLKKRYARKGNQDYWIYNMEMGDSWGNLDNTAASQALYDSEMWIDPDGREKRCYMAPMLKMLNETIDILEKDYPNTQFGTLAYFALETPPKSLKVHEKLHIRHARHRKTTVKSIEETTVNQSFRRDLERWLELAPGRVHVWDYGANFFNFLHPFPCLRPIAANIKLYHQLGVAGLIIQGNYNDFGGHFVLGQNYVWRKLIWDPTLDTETLIREFCDGYYGPAGKDVIAYLDRLDAAVRPPKPIPPIYTHEMGDARKDYLKLPLIFDLRKILVQAENNVADHDNAETYIRRIRELSACVDVAQYWRRESEGPKDRFVERDGRLLRNDFVGEYTYDKVVAFLPYLRGAGDTEWGIGRTKHYYQLRRHGGPVHRLKTSSMTLRVAPAQSGSMGPLLFRGKEVFTSTLMYSHKGKLTAAAITGQQPTETWMEMSGPGGLSFWESLYVHDLHQTIEAKDDKRFLINHDITLTNADPEYKNRVSAITETRYAVNNDLSDFSIATWSDTTKRWEKIDLSKLRAMEFPQNPKNENHWPMLKMFDGFDGRLRITQRGVTMYDSYALVDQKPQHFDSENPKPGELKPIRRMDLVFNKEQGIFKTIVYMGIVKLQMHKRVPVMKRSIGCKSAN